MLVHDAARPLVGDATIDRVVARCATGTCAIAALPVVDTLKEVDDGRRASFGPSSANDSGARRRRRDFRATSSCARIAKRKTQRVTATDDAALCERLGIPVKVVRGSERAMKITEEADFARAEALFPLPE